MGCHPANASLPSGLPGHRLATYVCSIRRWKKTICATILRKRLSDILTCGRRPFITTNSIGEGNQSTSLDGNYPSPSRDSLRKLTKKLSPKHPSRARNSKPLQPVSYSGRVHSNRAFAPVDAIAVRVASRVNPAVAIFASSLGEL